MKLNVLLFAALGFGVLAGCASGAGESPAAASAPASQESEVASNLAEGGEERKICKVRPITGSRFKQKTCMTAKEWENMRVETKKMLDEDTRSKPSNY